jgi:flagellar L-ring protein FlgH
MLAENKDEICRGPSRGLPRLPRVAGTKVVLHLLSFFLLFLMTACVTTQPTVPSPASVPPVNPMARTPLPPPPPQSAPELPTGSLWGNNSGSPFRDIKATRVGDIITITVSEVSNATKTAATTTARTKKFDGLFSFAGAGAGTTGVANPIGAAKFGPYEGKFGSSFDGSGSTNRTDSMSAYMTATVVDVLPNGNLIIRGSRWTKTNDEMQQTVLEGVVRPNDITRNNTVLSQNIADAKIFVVGKGPVAQHQKPGWMLQVFDFLSPF